MKPSECRGLALFQPHMHRLVRVGMQEPLILVRLYAGIIYVWDVLVFLIDIGIVLVSFVVPRMQ